MTVAEWQNGASLLRSWQRVLLLTHDRPDGDALGALAAMRSVLSALGARPSACVYDVIPARYEFLEECGAFELLPKLPPAQLDAQFDGILILDTCSWTQLESAAAYLAATRLPKLIVDHHSTRDDLTGQSPQALYLIDPGASSVCLLLYEWCVAMGWALPPQAQAGLFSGMATDTGWFRFPSTDPRTLRAAADLLGRGLRPDIMYARLMEAYSVARLRLLAQALSTLELHADGRIAVMQITPEMFTLAGAVPADTEDIVNEPLKSREIIASVLLTDHGDGRVRVNLRSKSPEVVGFDLDVAQVAARFGGGGHRRASGARVEGDIDQVADAVTAAMGEAIQVAKAGATGS